MKTRLLILLLPALFASVVACSNDPGDCSGDPVVGSESHWANCGNGATNAAVNNATANNGASNGGISDAGNAGNNTTANNTTANNTTPVDAGQPDAGGDAGGDAGFVGERCRAYRFVAPAFEIANCDETSPGNYDCVCFDKTLAAADNTTCEEALALCGALPEDIGNCEIGAEDACTATDDGFDCTCSDGTQLTSIELQTCDAALLSTCFDDLYCTDTFGEIEALCRRDYGSDSGEYDCSCSLDGEVTEPSTPITATDCQAALVSRCAVE